MAQNQLYLIKSGENSFVEETQAIVGISGGKVGIGTTVPESDFHVAGNTQIDGDLTVKGNFTTVDSTTIQVDDKNIELGVIDSPTNATAHGGGITLKGTTDKTIDWQTGNAAWNFSENLYIANGRHFAGDELRALDAGGLSLFDNNASGITVKAGKVGVHKTSPVYDLDVVGSGNFSAGLYVSGNSVLTGTAADLGKWSDGSTAGEIYYNGGNVGIATNDPAYTLDVVGTGNFTTLTVQGNSVLTGSAADLSKWSDGSTAGEIYYTGGNVGIATNDPAATLDVIGSGNFSAGLYVNGNSVLTGTSENLSKWSSGATAGEIYYTGGNVGIATNNPAYTLDVAGGGNFTSLTVQGNSVLTGTAADLGKWSDGSAGEIYYNGGNVGIATNNPAATLDVNGSLNVEGNFTILDQFNFGSNGSVGGVVPSAVDDIIKWNGTKWVAGANPGGAGAGGGEVPSALINSLISGQSVQSIAFLDTYDTAPRIATELEIDGEGSIIPYVISGVSTTGYNLIFSQEIPNNNYKIHTVFGGKDVYWETGASNSLAYNDGDVSLLRNLSVGGNLTVQGNSVLTGSAADLGKWEDAVSAGEIYYNGGNVGIGTSDPAYSLHVNGTIYNENGGINIANKFNVSTLGAVGGQSPAFNEVIKWDGSKWIAGSAPGGGTSSSSEVPSAFDTWLSQGSAVQPISFVDAPEGGYQSIPSISTDVEIIEGDIIPYAISGVSTTGYYAVFSDPIPTANNYKIHTTFGGKEVYWQTGAGGNSIYYNGDSVSVDDLIVGGNLTVNGTTTTVNTQTVEIEDHNLVIAANTGYNQLTAEYPGAGGAYAGILWGTGDAGAASPVSLTYQSNKGFAFEGGNVGIGTTSPGSKLEILNSSSTTDVDALTFTWEHLNQNAGIEQRIKWRFGDDATPDAPSDAAYIAAGKSNSWDTGAGRQSYLSFATANGINTVQYGGTEPNYSAVERMRIAYNGNVGIGTTSPGAKLHLSTAGADGLRLAVDSQTYYHMIRPNGDGLYLGADDGGTGGVGADIRFSVKGDEKMRIDSAGKLHVNGLITGGFGARSTTTDPAYKDWNHASNARGGMGHYLLFGDDTNGPEVGLGLGNRYFHIFNFEYGSKDGTGSLTQWAIGYIQNLFYMRTRYLGTWTAWTAII